MKSLTCNAHIFTSEVTWLKGSREHFAIITFLIAIRVCLFFFSDFTMQMNVEVLISKTYNL